VRIQSCGWYLSLEVRYSDANYLNQCARAPTLSPWSPSDWQPEQYKRMARNRTASPAAPLATLRPPLDRRK
jgi:hypothetical protein